MFIPLSDVKPSADLLIHCLWIANGPRQHGNFLTKKEWKRSTEFLFNDHLLFFSMRHLLFDRSFVFFLYSQLDIDWSISTYTIRSFESFNTFLVAHAEIFVAMNQLFWIFENNFVVKNKCENGIFGELSSRQWSVYLDAYILLLCSFYPFYAFLYFLLLLLFLLFDVR